MDPPTLTRGRASCYLLLCGQDPAVHLPLAGQSALHLVFAHRQLTSRLLEGGPLGEVVAHYVVGYADGTAVRLPIRERFEIATVPLAWGQLPFLAVPDQPDGLPARYAGDWSEAGDRLTEVAGGWPHSYFLWAWSNPHPTRPLTSLTIEPAGPAFLLAAVTLGHLDEEPFCRTAARTLKLTLPQPEDAARPFALRVAVDRGIATFPYALPAAPATFLPGSMPGFGDAANESSSPAYVQVAATPSATLSVALGADPVGHVRWGTARRVRACALR